jgi:uncharacterized protein YgbK (DUF1537 family)
MTTAPVPGAMAAPGHAAAAQVPLLKFVADDVTGATDVLDALLRRGFSAAVHMTPPDSTSGPGEGRADGDASAEGVQVVGVATTVRAWSADRARRDLPALFAAVDALPGNLTHFKVCSTFDSAPHRGNIGVALDAGRAATGSKAVPIVASAPLLGRYVAFGNLFATSGADPTAHRIDRHPVMSRHPATPMSESDLVRHLAGQTTTPVVSWTLLHDPHDWNAEVAPVVLFDAVTPADLARVGQAIWASAEAGDTRFCVGSSGLTVALIDAWEHAGITGQAAAAAVEPVPQLLVLSGSASQVTADQLRHAAAAGFVRIDVDMRRDPADALADAVHRTEAAWAEGASVIVETCLGPDDPRKFPQDPEGPDLVGTLLGEVGAHLATTRDVPRVLVCGGDTSGAVTERLGVTTLRAHAPLVPGAPLCVGTRRDGATLQVVAKGGQIGPVDVALRARGDHT